MLFNFNVLSEINRNNLKQKDASNMSRKLQLDEEDYLSFNGTLWKI